MIWSIILLLYFYSIFLYLFVNSGLEKLSYHLMVFNTRTKYSLGWFSVCCAFNFKWQRLMSNNVVCHCCCCYLWQMYPTSVRTTGVGTASSVGRIGGIICPLVAVALVQSCHQIIALVLFEFIIFISGVAVTFFPLETNGRSLNDSVRELK